jgi:arylsulfatase A-like enzyme
VPRNVLLVTADQWRGDCLSLRSHPLVKTPSFDAFAREGVAFANHYSVCAPCGPARASLLTGMYMHNHRSVRNGTPLEDRHTNLAREARRAGYRPLLFGYTDTSLDPRVHSADDVTRHGYENIMPGFEEGLLLPGEQPRAWLDDLLAKGYEANSYDTAFAVRSAPPKGQGRAIVPAVYRDEDSQTAFLTQRVINYLRDAEPGWFVHLSWFRPHPPFIAPEPWNRLYNAADVPRPVRAPSVEQEASTHPWLAAALGPNGDWYEDWMRSAIGTDAYDTEVQQLRATYYGLVSKVDHYFGMLIAFLRESGMLDDTLVVVTSDHGELLGDHYLFGKRGFHDAGFHIPLIVRDPDLPRSARGRIVESFSESVDVMPTILDWLGREAPVQCDGDSLLPVIHGTATGAEEVFWAYDFRNDSKGPGAQQALGLASHQCQLNVFRNRRYKYASFAALDPVFFDLEEDPAELVNRAFDDRYREPMLACAQRLLKWRLSTEAPALTHLKVTRQGILDLT